MWTRNELHLLIVVAATLSSTASCLDTVPRNTQERVIRHGMLFVGDQRKSISNKTQDDGDTDGYHADQPEAEVGYQLTKLKLHQLKPSVRCDNDSMTLRMLGKRVPDFLVERDGKNPVPLSEMPTHCGFSVKRARREVFLVAKYDGCHVTQQGDNYILPLRMWGAPVKMGCPVAALFLSVACTVSAMLIEIGVSMESLKLKVSGVWQPLAQACDTCGFTLEAVPSGWVVAAPYTSNCWQIEGAERLLSVLYSNGELTLSCPVATTPSLADQELPPVPPFSSVDYPIPYVGPEFWPFYPGYPGAAPRNPTTAPITDAATLTTPSVDEQFWYPYGYAKHWLLYPGYPGAPPRSPTTAPTTTAPTTTAPTTTTAAATTTTTVKPPRADEQFWNPYGHAKHWFFYPGYPGAPPRNPTTAPTTSATTTAATTVKPPTADHQHWSRVPWLPVAYDPLVPTHSQSLPVLGPASEVRQAHQMPWMSYPQRFAGRDQKGALPWRKWQYPIYQMPVAPPLQTSSVAYPSVAARHDHQGMPQLNSWPMYHSALAYSPPKQSSKEGGMDPKVAFDQAFAGRGWKSLLYPSQLSPLHVKAGPVYRGGDLVLGENTAPTKIT